MDINIKNFVKNKYSDILDVFNKLHNMPELSTKEFKTSSFIQEYLKKNQLDVKGGVADTGVITYIHGNEPGPVLGLRVDIDALAHNINGKIQAIHSCGHDANTTMGIFTGIVAKELGIIKKGSLKLIFQPSEEQEETSGARLMVKEGVIDDVDMLIGIHLRPINEAFKGQAISALKHGSLTTVVADIIGKGTHAGRPHQGKNPIDAIAAVINAVNAIWIDPSVPSSAKVTYIYSDGANFSSIPKIGKIGIDLRAQTNDTMDELIKKVVKAVEAGSSTIDCTAKIKVVPGLPAAVFHQDMIDIARESIIEILGPESLLGERYTTGSEDFHEYIKAKPNIKATYLGLGCNLKPGLHDPNMNFDKEALIDGISIIVKMVEKILN